MTRYIVLRDKINVGKFSAVKVNLDKDVFNTKSEHILIKFHNGSSQYFKKNWIYKTKEDAQRVAKEREIILEYKKKNRLKNNLWECSSCGRYVDKYEVTVDHIDPVTSFKINGNFTKESWEKCWQEGNLTIMCVYCNSSKSQMNMKKHLTLSKKSTYIKLKNLKRKREKIKCNTLALARRDSRILDKNVILKTKSKHWKKIDEVEIKNGK